MATRTAIQNGLWSDTTTWGGAAIPVNGDAVVINTGVTITFDVDQSGFANGLLSLQIDGKLTFKPDTNTCLKMNGNITGTGELWVGTEENPIQRPAVGSEYRAYLLFNSTGTINIPTIRMYGWYPDKEYTQLSADASSGQNQIVLEEDLGLQQGDIIVIGSGTEYGVTAETAKGIYTVSAYDTGTKTVTLTSNLQTNRLEEDYVAICSKPIKIGRSSGTTYIIQTAIPSPENGVIVGVAFVTGFLYSNNTLDDLPSNWVFKHCSEHGTGRYMAMLGKYVTFEDCVSATTTNFGLQSNIINPIIERCICFNSTGGFGYSKIGVVENSVAQNCGLVNGRDNYSKNIIAKNCNIMSAYAYNLGNIDSSIIDCQVREGNPNDFTNGGARGSIIKNSVFKSTCRNLFGDILFVNLYNCIFEEGVTFTPFNYYNPPWFKYESFDHNQIQGNYKAWCKGGRIETDFDGETVLPGRLILTCESDDYPVFRDFQVQLPQSRTMRWQALTKKDFTGGSVKIELIDPANDPLIDPSAQPLATYSLPDQADTNLPLKLGYKSTVPMQAILRISAQNASGTVEVDTRLIENRVQHGQ